MRLRTTLICGIMALTLSGAAAAESFAVVTKLLGRASLPCAAGRKSSCGAISWTFETLQSTKVFLVDKGAVNKFFSQRLKLHESSCSLNISDVTERDVGTYQCHISAAPRSDHTVSLSVVKAVASQSCAVVSVEPERFTVTHTELVPSPSFEIKSMGLKTEKNHLLCSILDNVKRKIHKIRLSTNDFRMFYQTLAPNTTATSTMTTIVPDSSTEKTQPAKALKPVLFAVIALIVVALLLLVFLTVFCWRQNLKRETQSSSCDAEEEAHYSTVTFENMPHRRSKPSAEDEDLSSSVVYSAVRAAQTDPSALYATVYKPSKL